MPKIDKFKKRNFVHYYNYKGNYYKGTRPKLKDEGEVGGM